MKTVNVQTLINEVKLQILNNSVFLKIKEKSKNDFFLNN